MPDEQDPQTGKIAWIWGHRKEIVALWERVRGWISPQPGTPEAERKGDILIIGPGGVGKSTLGRLLSGAYSPFDLLGPYDESIGVEKHALADDPGVEIVVTPGQLPRRHLTWDPLLAEMSAGKFRGVIILAAYGYHNHGIGLRASYKSHPLYKKGKLKHNTVERRS